MTDGIKISFCLVLFILMCVGCAGAFTIQDCINIIDPFTYADGIKNSFNGTSALNSSYNEAQSQFKSDDSTIAICHAEYWNNQSVDYVYGNELHSGGHPLNYVCYYRDGRATIQNLGAYGNFLSASSSALWYYNIHDIYGGLD